MAEFDLSIPADYQSSRQRFRDNLNRIRGTYPTATLHSFPVANPTDLTIDWIDAEPSRAHTLFQFTTGEHGIEGFIGSIMIQLFIAEFLPRLNSERVAIRIVHCINPWGMHNRRRVNASNTDINRNFILNPALFNLDNPGYRRMDHILNPRTSVRSIAFERIWLTIRVLLQLALFGKAGLTQAIISGQYINPAGIYFGGKERMAETNKLLELYRSSLKQYKLVVHLDNHTGFGPRNQMSLVLSALEKGTSQDFVRALSYPKVVKANLDEFYPISGDMVDCLYRLRDEVNPSLSLFGAALEFGSMGESIPAIVESLLTNVLENQLHHHGAVSPAVATEVRSKFFEMYCPSGSAWMEKALMDARQAFEGVLGHFHLFRESSIL
jgi:hypothetical protein